MARSSDKVMPADLPFLPDASAAIVERPTPSSRLILMATVAFFVTAIAWAANAPIDEVTRGTGKVVPSHKIQVVQNLEGGILSEILVREGDVVGAGQVLLRIDDTRFSTSFRESRMHFLASKAKAARLQAEWSRAAFEVPEEVASEAPQLVEPEQELFESRQEELRSAVTILEQQTIQRQQELKEMKARRDQLKRSLALLQRELDITKPLVAQGAASEVELLGLRRQVNDLRGQIESAQLAFPRLQAAYEEARRKAAEVELSFKNGARAELNEVTVELSQLSEANLALEDRVQRTLVRSPVRGTVKQLFINTVGGVIQPGMDLIEIVSLEDSLLVEARIRPADIAFLHSGQRALVKFTAYDYAIYGGLEAKVEHISADTIEDDRGENFYLVRVRTEHSHIAKQGETLPIITGMVANVDILAGKKTVLEYLMKPILRAREMALRER